MNQLPNFQLEPALIKIAFEHCVLMAKKKSFVPRVSQEPDLKTRCEKHGCNNNKIGQNTNVLKVPAAQSIVQIGQLDHSRAVFELLLDDGLDSKFNREYFLDPRYSKLGYGFVYIPTEQVYYITFIFAGQDYHTNYAEVEAFYTKLAEGKLMLEVQKLTFEEIEKIVETEKKAEQEGKKK